ncbi:MAG: preprotein translocase subunit SecE [Candidatus Omnitrophota bacterium]
MFGRFGKFIKEVVAELKKVSWTSRKELIHSTWVVIISSAFLGIFIAVTDFVLSKFIGVVIR